MEENLFPEITDEEIAKDIQDTKREIEEYERKVKGWELLGDRMSLFRADAARDGIKNRKEFIEKLAQILLKRNMPPMESTQ